MKYRKLYEKFYKGLADVSTAWNNTDYIEVFLNPNNQEVMKIFKSSETDEIRFSIDMKGNMYAWRGEALHKEVVPIIKITHIYSGYSTKKGIKEKIYLDREKDFNSVLYKMTKDRTIQNIEKAFPQVEEIVFPLKV